MQRKYKAFIIRIFSLTKYLRVTLDIGHTLLFTGSTLCLQFLKCFLTLFLVLNYVLFSKHNSAHKIILQLKLVSGRWGLDTPVHLILMMFLYPYLIWAYLILCTLRQIMYSLYFILDNLKGQYTRFISYSIFM